MLSCQVIYQYLAILIWTIHLSQAGILDFVSVFSFTFHGKWNFLTYNNYLLKRSRNSAVCPSGLPITNIYTHFIKYKRMPDLALNIWHWPHSSGWRTWGGRQGKGRETSRWRRGRRWRRRAAGILSCLRDPSLIHLIHALPRSHSGIRYFVWSYFDV